MQDMKKGRGAGSPFPNIPVYGEAEHWVWIMVN